MNPRDLPEVVAELIIEMHEVRSELKEVHAELRGIHEEQRAMREDMRGIREEQRAIREEARQNTDRLIEAFGRSMEPLINRLLDHESRLGRLENPE